MKNLLFAGIAGLSMLVVAPASAANDSFAPTAEKSSSTDLGGVFAGRRGGGGHPPVVMPGGHGPRPGMGGQHRWGHRMNGRWFAGHHAPGGWGGYRAPFPGFSLPTYWVSPSYRIVNYPLYGLYAPQTGYGWSRYYDDAVLMDQRGYVQDYRSNIPWDRYEGGYAPGDYPEAEYGPAMGADRGVYYGDDRVYSDNGYQQAPAPQPQIVYQDGTGDERYPQAGAPYAQGGYQNGGYAPQAPAYQSRYGFERYESCLRNRGIAGGVVGAVVGAVIGNRVAGRGDRLGGSLIGGGLGALAGVGIEKATKKCRKYLPREDSYYHGNGGHSGGYAPPPPAYYPQQPYPQHGGGYYQNGWYYPAPVVTTVTITPAVTTTTTVTEEVYYETVRVPAKRKMVKKWKPKPKPRCHCH
jgi:Nickel/cobalt transporter regulator